jgi:acetyltransferase
MKTTSAAVIVTDRSKWPDFCNRPRRINLEQLVAIKGYGKLIIRPIRQEDEAEMVRFHQRTPEESIYMRYFEYLGLDRRTSHERLVRICKNSAESYALVVERPAFRSRMAAILAVGRLTKTSEPLVATFDTLIAEETETSKLAKVLITRLIKWAHAFGFEILTSELLLADHDTLTLCRTLGFTLQSLPEGGMVRVTLGLTKETLEKPA